MPIKPENKALYPADWKAISKRIRGQAGNRCEFCGAINHAPHPITGSKVVLTVAHLDHNPSNCADSNLKAGDLLQGVNKAQGLKKGEHPIKLCVIRVENAWSEPLWCITPEELVLEGFPNMTEEEFITMFCKSHKGVTRDSEVTRIEFSYVHEPAREREAVSESVRGSGVRS